LFTLAGVVVGCGDSQPSAVGRSSLPPGESTVVEENTGIKLPRDRQEFVNRVRPRVTAFCSNCHVMPRPGSSSREDWVAEVNQGFTLYRLSGRSDLEVPPYEQVLEFFQCQAPVEVSFRSSIQSDAPTPIRLRPSPIRLPGNRPPGITNIRWIDIGLKNSRALVYCDIGSGAVKAHWPQVVGKPTERLATLFQPVHVEPCDLDADGHTDLVVADIGEFNAQDSDIGRVVWLRRKPDSEAFEQIVLRDGLSRVADVQPGDFDGDGDLDLMVAEFGWRTSGRIVLLENKLAQAGTQENEQAQFDLRVIDPRHGAIHVPPVDLNGDGHLDFVALISQHHEVVEAFINDGNGSFDSEVIWQAPDPAYGSSGIELVDLDNDGDLDVLYSNGDSFDRGPKPHHSVQWLENDGDYPYKHHHLCKMPGVLNAKSGDFDGDGDLDIVAVSLLASLINNEPGSSELSSIMMLIQTSPGEFERTQVEANAHHHISVETGDFDDDGKLDFAAGTFLRGGGFDQPDLIIWYNGS
jgi:hypothetical protein